MSGGDWDAIVCGASFAGLAAASQIGGRVLLIDGRPIGDGETSASAVPVACLERMDLEGSIEQVHDDVVVHTKRHGQVIRFFPFATFDYRGFCRDLRARCDAEFLQARVTETSMGRVCTNRGTFHAPVVIDATGWRTSAPAAARGRSRAARRSFGVESRRPHRGTGLHFYVGPANGHRRFYWVFPAGDHVRAGLATYSGESGLSGELEDFLGRTGLGAPDQRHGGYFTSRLGEPIRDGVFVVGDAAGHCLPVSGEGIRPALVFGQVAGRLADAVRRGELTLEQGLSRYRAYIRSRARGYTVLDRLQTALDHVPDPVFSAFARAMARDRVEPWAARAYWRVANPELLSAGRVPDLLPPAAVPTAA